MGLGYGWSGHVTFISGGWEICCKTLFQLLLKKIKFAFRAYDIYLYTKCKQKEPLAWLGWITILPPPPFEFQSQKPPKFSQGEAPWSLLHVCAVHHMWSLAWSVACADHLAPLDQLLACKYVLGSFPHTPRLVSV